MNRRALNGGENKQAEITFGMMIMMLFTLCEISECLNVCSSVGVGVNVCVYVCVCECIGKRERERESVCVCGGSAHPFLRACV